MKNVRIRSARLLVVMFASLSLIATAYALSEIQIGQQFSSPDGKLLATITNEDSNGKNVRIRDAKTGEVYKAAASLPLFSFAWTGDSKTIALLEHTGGGSQLSLIHFNGREWQRREIEPPGGNEGHYEVLKEDIQHRSVSVSYKVTKEKPNGDVIGAYICSFAIDPSTGAVSNLKKHIIDLGAYRRLHYQE